MTAINRRKTVKSVNLLTKALTVFLLGASASPFPGFSQTPGAAKPSFEVASIRQNTSKIMQWSMKQQPGGRFLSNGVPLQFIIMAAYRLRDFQLIGCPAWVRSDRWDIDARAEEGAVQARTEGKLTDDMALMVQSLLKTDSNSSCGESFGSFRYMR
jgi:hypothetical protein